MKNEYQYLCMSCGCEPSSSKDHKITECPSCSSSRIYIKLQSDSSAIKHDEDKLRFDLIPVYPLSELAKAYTVGAKKYADRNWEGGMKWGKYFAACCRHIYKWWNREKSDTETGVHHLAAAVFCLFALMEYEETHPDLDDRPKPEVKMT